MTGTNRDAARRSRGRTRLTVGALAWLTGLMSLLSTHPAHALGLGQATVRSYYQQPLNVRIDLISRSEAEMATVTAGLASPSDFQVMGLSRAAISTPLEFTIHRGLADPHIQVTSKLPINEPVVQLVIEVVWSSGRMLRQYTLFLDPPTFDAPAPLPSTSSSTPTPRPVPRADAPASSREELQITAIERPSERTSPFTDEAPEPVSRPPVADAGPPFDPAPEPRREDFSEVPGDVAPPARDLVIEPPPAEPQDRNSATPPADLETPVDDPGAAIDAVASMDEASTGEAATSEPAPSDPFANESATGDPGSNAPTVDEFIASEPVTSEPVTDELIADQPIADAPIADEPAATQADATKLADSPTDASQPSMDEPVANDRPAAMDTDAVTAASPGDDQEALSVEAQPPDPERLAENDETRAAEPQITAPVEDAPSAPAPEAFEPVELVYRAVLPEPGQPLPGSVEVRRGDTLWSLSRDYAESQGASINQVMLAVQQKNPQAFVGGNINAMLAGQVLRMPERDEVLRTGARDAMLEVLRQEELYRSRYAGPASADELPTVDNLAQVATTGDDPAEIAAPEQDLSPVEEDSRLELVPPSGDEAGSGQGMGLGTGGDAGVSSGESVVEELARTQEELANARQENAYLAERITELEAELARQDVTDTTGVADTNLAEMEDRLREERAADAPEPEVDMTPPDQAEHWLTRFGWWLLGLLLVAVAGVVLFLRSRRDPAFTELPDTDEPLTLPDEFPEPDPEDEATRIQPAPVTSDEAPGDPEARLDLARAYLAMGKSAQARELLDEVIREGDAEQVREARDMLGEL